MIPPFDFQSVKDHTADTSFDLSEGSMVYVHGEDGFEAVALLRSTQTAGRSLSVLIWDGVGDLKLQPSGTSTVNGAASVTFTGGVQPPLAAELAIFLIVYTDGNYFAHRFYPNHTSGDSVLEPNLQRDEDTGVISCGQSTPGALFLSCDPATVPPTQAADSIALGDVVGALSAEAIVLGKSAGAVAANGLVVGKAVGTVAAGAISVGSSTGNLAAGEICLGDGVAASTVAGRLSIKGEGASVDVIAASTHSIPIAVNGVLYKILLST
jgi:hypothetical protein